MCEAIRGMIEEGRLAGVEQGIRALIEVCEDMGVSKEETVTRVMDKFSIPRDNAEGYMGRYWKQ